MIVYDLSCENGHGFEGWFGSSADFAAQQERGLLTCPHCDSASIHKAPMAPSVPRKGNQNRVPAPAEAPAAPDAGKPLSNQPMPPEMATAIKALAKAQTKALKDSTWVGKDFADQSRAMHYGEREKALIHGEASAQEARELLEEGVQVAPLLVPVAPPEKLN